MTTWKGAWNRARADRAGDPARCIHGQGRRAPARARAGTAIFMTAQPRGAPAALVHNLQYNKVLHQHVVVLMVTTRQVPHVRRKSA